jgi:hypothetical protein
MGKAEVVYLCVPVYMEEVSQELSEVILESVAEVAWIWRTSRALTRNSLRHIPQLHRPDRQYTSLPRRSRSRRPSLHVLEPLQRSRCRDTKGGAAVTG